MAGKSKRTRQVNQILRMHRQGKRHKTIARTMGLSIPRLTEGRGTGIPTIVKALKDNGSDATEFYTNEPSRAHFLIEIPIHPDFKANNLTIEQIKVLKYGGNSR